MKDQVPGEDPMKLSNATLDQVPAGVSAPTYDRSALTPGIVHIGLGNFHRAHQAWYLHRLMQRGLAHDWAIIGAGVRAGDAAMRTRLLAQDCLTTLIELSPGSMSAEVAGAMIDFLPVADDNAPLIAQMSDPVIRIVSLTVTEGGYYRDADGVLDTDHPDIQHDAANPATPRTAFGAMIAALRARRDAGHGPFTGQCCDNLQDNGAVLRQTVVGLARLSDPDLADWIDANATFPNAMVDCIVPATGPAEVAKAKSIGIDDQAPVTHENFRQWVIEDRFCAGRPPWEQVGATITENVHPYESMKIRMLNAGHQLLANAGEVLGRETISACMADADIAGFFRAVQLAEMIPHVDPVPGMTAQAYLELITGRFANPEIHDTTRRVAFDGSSRHLGFILPILQDALDAGTPVQGLALSQALWCRMCAGTREDGSVIGANDPHWDTLTTAAQAARSTPGAWLDLGFVYGDLGAHAGFAQAFAHWLDQLWTHGTRATLRTYISSV
ncbi:MAG: mannitol dehydrogenase family protein [Pseudomonadota bacterium]